MNEGYETVEAVV